MRVNSADVMGTLPTLHTPDNTIYALIRYDDPYVQPLIISALAKLFPASSYKLISDISELPSPTSNFLQWHQYEDIDFSHQMAHPSTALTNSYIIRKALIRKHYLSTTVSNWVTKHPDSVLKEHVKPSVEFEVDYAEFLDDALVEAYELRESWAKGEGKEAKDREWWILKPGMSERGQGIRLFSSEEELQAIFEEWDPESSDDEDEEEKTHDDDDNDETARSDHDHDSADNPVSAELKQMVATEKEGNGVITSQLRHFIAQPYIHPPLLLPNFSGSAPRKWHIRTYALAVGALKVYVFKDMLALFAARAYTPPWETSSDLDEQLLVHLTNIALQDEADRDGNAGVFSKLPATLPAHCCADAAAFPDWKKTVFDQILAITSATFAAAARSMSIHFQALPNSFEIFGLDYMVGLEAGPDGKERLTTYLLEANAFPAFKLAGGDLAGVLQGLFEGIVDVGVRPFFEVPHEAGFGPDGSAEREQKMIRVLDIDLGRR